MRQDSRAFYKFIYHTKRTNLMSDSKWILTKSSDTDWKLELSVDSGVIETLKWVWNAGVSVEDDQNRSTIKISHARHTAVGMPEGDGPGSFSHTTKLTNGVTDIPSNELESVLEQWELECRRFSKTLDNSVVGRRRELEQRRAIQEKRNQEHQTIVSHLDSLSSP